MSRPYSHLCPKSTKKSFLETDISQKDLMELYVKTEDWHTHKLIATHRNCPDFLTEEFLKSPVWYIRLTAGLTKEKRARYTERLFSDKKSTVRAAAYKTAIVSGIGDLREVCQKIVDDKFAHGYFGTVFWNLELIKRVASGEIQTIEAWEEEARQFFARSSSV
jgi:hypothetical protein